VVTYIILFNIRKSKLNMKSILFLIFGLLIPFFLVAQIDTEPTNNTLSGADMITISQDNNATINPAGDVDYYKFTVPRSCLILYKFENVPSNLRMQGRIYDANGIEVGNSFVYGSQGQNYTWETKVCQGGLYRLQVSARDGNASASLYNVTVSIDTSDVYECNDNLQTATQIELNEVKSAAIRTPGDVDYYKFNVPRSCIILYKFENVPSDMRMQGRIYDANGIEVGNSFVYGSQGQNYTWETKVCQGGLYRLQVSARDGNASASLYNVTVSIDTSDVYECNNTFLEAKIIPCNTPVFASIKSSNDVDYYKFLVQQSGNVTLTISNVPSNIDIEGQFRNDLNIQIGNSFSAGDGQSIIATFNAPQQGMYYFYLTDDESNGDLYKLVLSCSGTIDINEDNIKNDISIFPNPVTESLFVDILGVYQTIDYQYEIRNPIGELLLFNQINSSREEIDVSTLPQGLYFIELKGKEGRISKQFIKL
jgi:hypothetical protein